MKLTVLVDSVDYVKNEVYQQHVHAILPQYFDVTYIEYGPHTNRTDKFKGDENVFICMKSRNLLKHVHDIKIWLGDRKPIVQDYDPWVFYDDTSPYKGGYDAIAEKLKEFTLFVPSQYWSSITKTKSGIDARPFKLGIPPDKCEVNFWQCKANDIIFRGSSYPSRERSFAKLSQQIPVVWKRDVIRPHSAFVSYLRDVKIWAQDESDPIVIDGIEHSRNWLWPKAIEVLSMGCFLIRNFQEESLFYEIDKMPTAFLYNDVKETPDILNMISAMSVEEKNQRIVDTVNFIKKQDYYVKYVCAVKDAFNEKR